MSKSELLSSKTESNRDKVLRGEVVKVTDDRLREMQEQARRMMGVGDTEYHWHWSAVINELIARRADETSPKHQGWCASINPDPCNCGVATKGASEWCPHYDLPIVNQPGCPDCAYEKTTGQWDPRAVAVKQDPHCATCKCFSEEPAAPQPAICPGCSKPLHKVARPAGSMLNDDQFDAVRAGDWYCDTCPSNDRGNTRYRYFWDREVRQEKASGERCTHYLAYPGGQSRCTRDAGHNGNCVF